MIAKILPATVLLLAVTTTVAFAATASPVGAVRELAQDGPRLADMRAAHHQALQTHLPLDAMAPLGVPVWLEQKVTALDGATDDVFGFSVAIDGDTALIGAPQGAASPSGSGNGGTGAVYVLQRQAGSWVEVQKLLADDGADNDQFGYAIALQDDTAVIGAAFATIDGHPLQGAAYVFKRVGATWTQVHKLVAADGAAGDQLGWSVALDGADIVLGARGASGDGQAAQGAAYAFSNDGSGWSPAGKLGADDGVGNDQFGYAVAARDGRILVSAPNAMVGSNVAQGAAYVFDHLNDAWTQSGKLVADDGAMNENFGYSLAYDGQSALVSSPFATVGANAFQGAVYAFAVDGNELAQTQKIVADEGMLFDVFGISVSLSGSDAIITAPFFNGSQGAAYAFSHAGDGTWTQQHTFVASDAVEGEGAAFGYAGAISDGTVLIGQALAAIDGNAYQGAAWIYSRPPTDTIFANGFDPTGPDGR